MAVVGHDSPNSIFHFKCPDNLDYRPGQFHLSGFGVILSQCLSNTVTVQDGRGSCQHQNANIDALVSLDANIVVMTTDKASWLSWLSKHPVYLVPSFAAYFIALWALVGFVIGQVSGWALLSHRFRDRASFHSYQWQFQSARMRTIWGSYHNVIKFGADETGLYMSVFLAFRVGHAPLFVPWAEIQICSGVQGLLFKSRKLLLGRQESIPLLISVSLADKIQSAAGQGWPVETIGA